MNDFCRVPLAAALLTQMAVGTVAQTPSEAGPPLTTRCESAPITAAFAKFGETGRMPSDLGAFLANAPLQRIEPYKAFDNVYYVGICWVSAWLITSPAGHILIDTLYGEYTDRLLANIREVGLDPKDIKLVVVTHGHFDHAGGVTKLKSELDPKTRFAMTREGWREAQEDAAARRPFPWTMIEPDIVLADGQRLTYGGVTIQAFETPGHTMGTASFAFDVRDGARTYRAFTVGGLGLNAIRGPEQVEAFIASVKRIRALTEAPLQPIQLHLTTHGFSTGLTEAKELLKTCKPGDPHPLIDLAGFRRQLDGLQAGAEKRLIIERQKRKG
ncbi:MAG: MBL fold metallo-hydrolase [Hyphomicrobiaceae bacterium]|nr:MAG: MBL fold metallo-hydrolase [Hyphomicrobiaceae bacterium]